MRSFIELENYAKEHDIPIMQKDGMLFLMDLIQKEHVSHILEIGSAIGYSALCMAEISESICVDTIERDETRYKQAKHNITSYQMDDRIRLYHMDAYDFTPNQTYDLIFIDAAKAQYQGFFDRFKPYLNKNGCIVVDNLNFHGLVDHPESTHNRNTKQLVKKIKQFREGMLQNPELNVEYYDTIGDGIFVIRLNS